MSYALFIDDLREPHLGFLLARSFDEAIKTMKEHGCPTVVSFDHDLGPGKTGYDVAWWMVGQDMDSDGKWIPENFEFFVHSANPVGRDNISKMMTNYLKMRKTS